MSHHIHRSEQRGYADHGWLQAKHSFSFAHYYDAQRMGFGALRVINEDRVAAQMGFGMHGHQDMEIITVILEGSLMHRDSMGNEGVIRAGQVQKMSAGRGVRHSEMNPERSMTTHLLQIWIEPNELGIEPEYEQHDLVDLPMVHGWRTIAADVQAHTELAVAGRAAGAMRLYQDANLLLAQSTDLSPSAGFEDNQRTHEVAQGRIAYLHVATGSVQVNGAQLNAGDAIEVTDAGTMHIKLEHATQVLLFDLKA